MTETNVEQNNPAGAGGATNPPASQGSGNPVAVDANTLSKLVKETIAEELKPIKGEISGIYSRQDKDRNAFREFMDEVKKQQAKGLSEDAAIDAAQNALNEKAETVAEKKMIRDIHAKLFGDSSATPTGNGNGGTAEMAQLISSYKLDANDPEVLTALTLSGDAFRAKIADIAYRRATQQPPSPSAAPSGTMPVGSPAPDVEKLYGELQVLYKNPSAPGAMTRITQIQEQIKKAG